MKLSLERTPELLVVNGVPARVWVGRTEDGVLVSALICVLKPHANTADMDPELTQLRQIAAHLRSGKVPSKRKNPT